ncbi:G protein-activated inward rectifier potassium channel 3-like isoform X1 [Melanaphis sacchari]|uniref:Inward rectifier potassium channel irk-1 n=2 Tax=Melanaphis sacchari TaxID=742174 RepID=A0A2H8TJ63_9HEMI|nr:G protein-activated inward rectifier potassium channel 3-like isoform X1 [Melanaphis sacchari]
MPERNMNSDRTSPPPSKLPSPATSSSVQVTNRAKRPNALQTSNTGYKGSDDHRVDQRDAALLLSPLCDEALLSTDSDGVAINVEYPVQANGQPVVIPVTKHNTRKSHLTSPSIYRKAKRRALFKNGECNIVLENVSKLRRRYLQDLFTTLVDARWRWTLCVFVMSFLLSWLAFGIIWYLIAFTHGDLSPENIDNPVWSPCVINMKTFMASFLFSVETQHTTGYGYRMVTEECHEAIVFFCFQSIAGLMIQAFMVGIVFSKMSRPKQRSQTIMFSKNAVICRRDGQLCFMFRVGDMREKSHLIGTTIQTRLIRSRVTPEGETLSPHVTCLKISIDDDDERVFLMWPTIAVHVIDQDSPLYGMSAADLLNEKFEVIVILEGTTESTGQTTQARTSYLSSEVLWGHRFRPLVKYCKTKLMYEVDYSQFHDVCNVDTPLCSAKDLETYLMINEPKIT